jgi:hypothetical protein
MRIGGSRHGAISLVTLVIGIFDEGVRMYEVHNTGGWYDFGFFLGASCSRMANGRSFATPLPTVGGRRRSST